MKSLFTLCKWVAAIGFINVIVFMVVALLLGGDAVNGGVLKGHYYLAEHGHRTEVSHDTWVYSRVHVYSVLVSAPLGMIAAVVGTWIKKKYPAIDPDMPD